MPRGRQQEPVDHGPCLLRDKTGQPITAGCVFTGLHRAALGKAAWCDGENHKLRYQTKAGLIPGWLPGGMKTQPCHITVSLPQFPHLQRRRGGGRADHLHTPHRPGQSLKQTTGGVIPEAQLLTVTPRSPAVIETESFLGATGLQRGRVWLTRTETAISHQRTPRQLTPTRQGPHTRVRSAGSLETPSFRTCRSLAGF